MATQNTGYARMSTLTVTKGTYSHSYSILNTFATSGGTTYDAITATQFAQLSEDAYAARLAAFQNYVFSQESGMSTDCPDLTPGSVVYDPISCPISLQQNEEH